jgi:transcriptional regulator with XRE-family HTH domain
MDQDKRLPGSEWRVRLLQCIADDGRSARKIGKLAGVGGNYVRQMINDGKQPSFDIVVRLCEVLDISVTYIVSGAKMSRYEEEVLAILTRMDDQQRQALRAFLETLAGSRAPSR